MAMWGGRFTKGMDPEFAHFQRSLEVDWRLLEEDIEGSKAWAEALAEAGVLSREERDWLLASLGTIALAAQDQDRPPAGAPAEDVHTFVEDALSAAGAVAAKLHTGRSRNEQMATDLRLFAKDFAADADAALLELEETMIAFAERTAGVAIPGYTHLRAGQPVLFAHWALAYFEMFERDRSRLRDAVRRADLCPLGSGALAGCAYPVHREKLAKRLSFAGPTRNSIDAVSDRDFAADLLSAGAIGTVHLSRLAEDLILYSSPEFGFVELDESVCTGSSLMPQKKNPDALELIRAKAGRLIGSLTTLLATLKGLPLAYDRDLQDDKAPLFEGCDAWLGGLRVAARVVAGCRANPERCRAAAAAGLSTATDLADWLVKRGVPFRAAHGIVGKVVRRCLDLGKDLATLPLEEYRAIDPTFDESIFEAIPVEASLAARDVLGGTAPARVASAIAEAKHRLAEAKR
ncbi:MAG TPA: argininosuccinate lyase [Planctomycetota bacterium]|jgi:argininosuccinate lyase/amino-acid N-acetyltransferase|nr:argininosuccinate lyase [Planctomycetota bacterium]